MQYTYGVGGGSQYRCIPDVEILRTSAYIGIGSCEACQGSNRGMVTVHSPASRTTAAEKQLGLLTSEAHATSIIEEGTATGEHCMYHHVRSETVRARYSIGDETSSDISIQLEGTLALTISASGTVRFGCAVPREWAYFRALSVVLRALHLRLIYVGEVSGEWRGVSQNQPRPSSSATAAIAESTGTVLSTEEDTSVPAFAADHFEHVRWCVRRLPSDIEVSRVPNPT